MHADARGLPISTDSTEAVAAFEIASALIEKFGGDSIDEMKRNFEQYRKYLKDRMGIVEEQAPNPK